MAYLGYLPEKDDKFLASLPKIMCLVGEGYSCTIPVAVDYLNDKHFRIKKATVKAKFIIRNDIDFHTFANWFNQEVNRGSFWFHTQLKFFGVVGVFRCRFISNISEESVDGIKFGTVNLEIDNFYNMLIDPTVNYMLYCDDITSCSEILECV